jgi:hypothetical protein
MIEALNRCCFQTAVCHEKGMGGASAGSCMSPRSIATYDISSAVVILPWKQETYPDIFRNRVSYRSTAIPDGWFDPEVYARIASDVYQAKQDVWSKSCRQSARKSEL